MLPLAHQQTAAALARNLRHVSPHINVINSWPHRTPSSQQLQRAVGSTASSAATAVPAAALDEQGNLPHVSVLLQEVLENLNHMPIKVTTHRYIPSS